MHSRFGLRVWLSPSVIDRVLRFKFNLNGTRSHPLWQFRVQKDRQTDTWAILPQVGWIHYPCDIMLLIFLHTPLACSPYYGNINIICIINSMAYLDSDYPDSIQHSLRLHPPKLIRIEFSRSSFITFPCHSMWNTYKRNNIVVARHQPPLGKGRISIIAFDPSSWQH